MSASTFADAVAAGAHRDAVFAIAPQADASLSHAQLAQARVDLEAAFDAWGIEPGAIVAYMLPNGLAALQLFLATMACGRIVLPFNLLAQDSQLDYVIGHGSLWSA